LFISNIHIKHFANSPSASGRHRLAEGDEGGVREAKKKSRPLTGILMLNRSFFHLLLNKSIPDPLAK